MRRPIENSPDTYRQIVNKQIQRFNETHSSTVEEEMYYLSKTAGIEQVARAINDFDYLINSYSSKSDELIEDYLTVRENLIGYRNALYASYIHDAFTNSP